VPQVVFTIGRPDEARGGEAEEGSAEGQSSAVSRQRCAGMEGCSGKVRKTVYSIQSQARNSTTRSPRVAAS